MSVWACWSVLCIGTNGRTCVFQVGEEGQMIVFLEACGKENVYETNDMVSGGCHAIDFDCCDGCLIDDG